MFLIDNDGIEKKWEATVSRGSIRSSDTLSTTSSAAETPIKPSDSVIKALIRDLSFWDAIPPVSSNTFPSPLPQKPRLASQSQQYERPQFMLQRGKNVSADNSRRHSNRQASKGTIDDHNNSDWRPQPVWKAAVDPATGRTYYYDAVTRQTQWEKVGVLFRSLVLFT